ncbi:putative ribonuclease H-like domain-containing protein [Tanacetum coccineum]
MCESYWLGSPLFSIHWSVPSSALAYLIWISKEFVSIIFQTSVLVVSDNIMECVLHSFFAENESDQDMIFEDFYAGRKMNYNNQQPARFDRRKVRCYKCLQLGHFARECNVKTVDDKARYSAFKVTEVKTDEPKALVSVDSMVNWSDHAAENKTGEVEKVYGMMAGLHADNGGAGVSDAAAEFAMMGISPKVQNCPLGCDSKINDLNNMYNNLDRLYNDCYIKVQAYQNAVKTLESQKDWYHKTQMALEEKIRVLSANLENTTNTLSYTEKLHDQAQKEKKEWEVKYEATLARFEKWKESSKNLNKLINSSMSTRTKIGLGFKDYFGKDEVFDLSRPSTMYPEPVEEGVKPLYSRFVKAGEMHAVPPSITGTYMPTPYKSDIEETQASYGSKSNNNTSETISESNDFVSCDTSDQKSFFRTSGREDCRGTYDLGNVISTPSSISELQPEQNVTCLVAKASLDESTRWHRRMAHVNFKTINKLAKEGTKDETFYVLKEFIALIENQLNKKVKGIRCDNGTEFKNAKLIDFFCGEKELEGLVGNPRTHKQDAAARYGYLFSQETAEILSQAEAEIRNQGVSADWDPAGINFRRVVYLLFSYLLLEPTSIAKALEDPDWVAAMQEEMQQFINQKVWTLVPLPDGKNAIGTKWILKNMRDARGIVVRNKARWIVKSAFLYGEIEVKCMSLSPKGLKILNFPKHVRGTIDKTLFIKKDSRDISFVQVYVDDIIFGSTNKAWCEDFEVLMKGEFEMSVMGEMSFFLGLQVQQLPDGIFISQDKYVKDMLTKFDMESVRTATTPYEAAKTKLKDETDPPVNVHLYRSMIGSLMYLTASRPDIMFAVSACSRHQVTPLTSHLNAVKKIFKYLKGQPKLGLWYPKDSPFQLEAYSDSDYAGSHGDRKSTTGGCQFLGRRLISWQCKKQTIVATSSTEAEYVAAASCCAQVLWIQNQLLDYGFNFMNTKIFIDNQSTICIVKNPVFHQRTKHIEIRHHFIRDANEKNLIQVLKIHTDDNVADLLTKAFDGPRFEYLVVHIGMVDMVFCWLLGCLLLWFRGSSDSLLLLHDHFLLLDLFLLGFFMSGFVVTDMVDVTTAASLKMGKVE